MTSGEVQRKVFDEMKLIHKQEIEFTRNRDFSPPDWSNSEELLLRKEVKAYRRNNKI